MAVALQQIGFANDGFESVRLPPRGDTRDTTGGESVNKAKRYFRGNIRAHAAMASRRTELDTVVARAVRLTHAAVRCRGLDIRTNLLATIAVRADERLLARAFASLIGVVAARAQPECGLECCLDLRHGHAVLTIAAPLGEDGDGVVRRFPTRPGHIDGSLTHRAGIVELEPWMARLVIEAFGGRLRARQAATGSAGIEITLPASI